MDMLKRWMVSLLAVVLMTLTFAGTGLAGTSGVFDPNVNGTVNAIVVQPDGKILIGGNLSQVGTTTSANTVRLNTDGTVDTTYTSPATDGVVNAIALQTDGKILIGGWFTQVGGTPRNCVARLNSNGTIDTTFSNPVVVNTGLLGSVYVNSIAVQQNGQILVGGVFDTVGGATRIGIARLNTNGAVDASFNAVLDSVGVNAIALQSDGKIVIGGDFAVGTAVGIARLNMNGSLDPSFTPPATDYTVYAIALQPNGSIVIGGGFSNVGTTARNGVARLSATGSLDSSFNPNAGSSTGATPGVNAVALQPDGKIVIGGQFTTVGGVTHNHVARLNTNGTPDATFTAAVNTGGNSWVSDLAVLGDGGILVGGEFSTVNGYARNSMARFEPDGSVINGFNPVVDPDVPARDVSTTALQPDGKVLIGGTFSNVNGTQFANLARLNTNGSLDFGFNPPLQLGVANSTVDFIAVQPDGKVIIGGYFSFNGLTNVRLARLNADGSRDASFTPPAFNSYVRSMAVQADGKILVGGHFTGINGPNQNYLARLNAADGKLDASFVPIIPAVAGNGVYTIAVQPDGKIVIGGNFTSVNGTTRTRMARLNPTDGSLDPGFADTSSAAGIIYAIALQPDGNILAGGTSTVTPGNSFLGRFKADGTTDASFTRPAINNTVDSIALQTDGKILIGGIFAITGSTINRLARLNPDGSLDTSLNTTANDWVQSITIQSDGNVIASGTFTTITGVSATGIARIANTAPAVQSLTAALDGSSLTWLRSGTGPEIGRESFELSGGPSIWTMLGSGARISGGWQLAGLSLPFGQYFTIRARGEAQTGLRSVSRSLVETAQTFCLISLSPVATAGTSVSQTGFTANWNASAGAAGYRLDVATDSGFTSFVAGYNNRDVGNVTSYALGVGNVTSNGMSGLTPGSTYYVRVRAYNLCGTSGNSNTITVILPPANPLATAASGIGRTGFTVNWNGSAGATGYRLDVAADGGFTGILSSYQDLDAKNVTSYVVTGLAPGTTYYYRVRAYNLGGTSGNSNTVTVSTNATLIVTIGGSGSGSVNSNPGGIACTKGASAGCSAEFAFNSTVNLIATPDWKSLPGIFSGAGSGSVTMNGDKGVSVTFNPNYQVRVPGATQSDYAAIQDGYTNAGNGSTIMAQVCTFYENIVFGRGITVTLDGGKDGNYQPTAGYSTVQGSFTIGQGAVVINRVIIH